MQTSNYWTGSLVIRNIRHRAYLSGKILAVYKSIGSKPQAPFAVSYKRGRPLSNAGVSGRKKAKVCVLQ